MGAGLAARCHYCNQRQLQRISTQFAPVLVQGPQLEKRPQVIDVIEEFRHSTGLAHGLRNRQGMA